MVHKWNNITAEIDEYNPDIICITESWLSDPSELPLHYFRNYVGFSNVRANMKGGGVLIFANPKYVPVAHVLHNEVTVNNAFNVCVISIGKANCRATIAAVYRAPWANKNDTKNLLSYLSSLAPKSKRFIVVGDFNLPKINWFDSSDTAHDGMSNALCLLSMNV